MSDGTDNRTMRDLEERIQELRAENAALREASRRWLAVCAMVSVLSCVAAVLVVAAGELGGRGARPAVAAAADPEPDLPGPAPEPARLLPEPAKPVQEPPRPAESLALPEPEEPAAAPQPAPRPAKGGGWTDLELPRPEKPSLPRVREAAVPELAPVKPFQLPEPSPGAQVVRYRVVRDDTLSKISRKFYGNYRNIERIKRDNGLVSDDLRPGMVLTIRKP